MPCHAMPFNLFIFTISSNWILFKLYRHSKRVERSYTTDLCSLHQVSVTAWLFKFYIKTAGRPFRNKTHNWSRNSFFLYYRVTCVSTDTMFCDECTPHKKYFTNFFKTNLHITLLEIIYNCCNPLSLRKSIVHRNIKPIHSNQK